MTNGKKEKKGKKGEVKATAKKRANNLKKKLPKNEAIILSVPQNGPTYAEIIRKAKEAVPNLEELGIEVVGTKRTAAGDILLEINSKEKAILLAEKLGTKMQVRHATKTTPVLILGLDESITPEELRTELAKLHPELTHIKPFDIRVGFNGWCTARIEAPIATALTLATRQKIRIGWNYCRIRLPEERKKTCFKCLETGHLAAMCKGEDRSRCCFRCKEEGHVAKDCKAQPTGTTAGHQ